MRPTVLLACTLALTAAAAPSPALACSLLGPNPFTVTVDPAVDPVAPTLDGDVSVEVLRGRFLGGDSCSDLGFVDLSFAPAVDEQELPTDDEVRADEWPGLGYQLSLVAGSLPEGLSLGEGPVHARRDGDAAALSLVWVDGADAGQEPVDFTLALTAVDGAGNESEPVEFSVADAGGCSTTGGHPTAALLGVGVGLGLLRRAGHGRTGAPTRVVARKD